MNLFALFHSATREKCDEFNLVLNAVNIDSEVTEHEGRYYLLVEEKTADDAYEQLQHYVHENEPDTRISRPLITLSKGYIGAYLYAFILLVVALLVNTSALGLDWKVIGLADSFSIAQGQWWRNITALTLHANTAHLAGNIGFGVLFGLLVSQHIGSAVTWALILLSGALGNALNAALHQTLHQSLGASTAVFAALGILGVFALDSRIKYPTRSFRYWLPFISTLALLAFTGTAGENTDIMAHLTGYLSGGIIAAIWLALGKPQIINRLHQALLACLSIGVIMITWWLAISAA